MLARVGVQPPAVHRGAFAHPDQPMPAFTGTGRTVAVVAYVDLQNVVPVADSDLGY